VTYEGERPVTCGQEHCDRAPGSRRLADNTRVGLQAAFSDSGPMINVTACSGGRAGQRRSNIKTVSVWLGQLSSELQESAPPILSQCHGRGVMHDTLIFKRDIVLY